MTFPKQVILLKNNEFNSSSSSSPQKCNQEPAVCCRSPAWVEGVQTLELSYAGFPRPLTQSWMEVEQRGHKPSSYRIPALQAAVLLIMSQGHPQPNT